MHEVGCAEAHNVGRRDVALLDQEVPGADHLLCSSGRAKHLRKFRDMAAGQQQSLGQSLQQGGRATKAHTAGQGGASSPPPFELQLGPAQRRGAASGRSRVKLSFFARLGRIWWWLTVWVASS